jgi:hypothetical protein
MQAYRNLQGNVIAIEVDVDPGGNPLLPPDTTVDAKPAAQAGHYVTVVGNRWVQIPTQVTTLDFSYLKQDALTRLSTYKDWYLDQPVEHAGSFFDGDAQARERLIQALTVYNEFNALPPAWIKSDNSPFLLTSINDLKGIIISVHAAFSARFFEMDSVRQAILGATNESELAVVTVPAIPVAM